MTGSPCTWDADGVEVSPIQQRAVMRELRRALVDPELDGVVLGRALHGGQWKEGFDSAVECVDARIEHLTGHIEGLAAAVPPGPPSESARGGLAQAVTRLREQIEVCEAEDTGGCVMETPRDGARQMAADLRLVLAAVPATTPGDDRGRELAVERVRAYLAAHDARYEGHEGAGGDSTATEVARLVTVNGAHRLLIDDLRALAAPAETEAVDERPTDVGGPDLLNEPAELRDEPCRCGTGLYCVVHLAATPPAPEGEAGSGLHARVTPGQRVRVGAMQSDGYADARIIVLPGGQDVAVLLDGAWPAPAGPQAEGAGEDLAEHVARSVARSRSALRPLSVGDVVLDAADLDPLPPTAAVRMVGGARWLAEKSVVGGLWLLPGDDGDGPPPEALVAHGGARVVDLPGENEHATVDGVVLRDQTAGELGLTARGGERS